MSKRLTACLPLLVLACAFVSTPQQARAPFLVTGQVVDAEGRPISGALIYAVPETVGPGAVLWRGGTNENGEFSVAVGSAGRYKMMPDHTDSNRMPQTIPFYRHPTLAPPVVTLNEANPAQQVRVEIVPPSGAVSLRLIDAPTGRPAERARIKACLAAEPTVCFRLSAFTAIGVDATIVRAAYLPFTIEVTADGYETWRAPGDAGDAAPLAVASGATLELDVKLVRRPGAQPEWEKRRGVHPPAPVQLSPAPDAVFDHYPRRTRLEWSPVAGAVSYSVEIDFCQPKDCERKDGRSVFAEPQSLFLHTTQDSPPTGITGTSYEFRFVGAQPGRWRVWAVDAEGREGFKSGWRRFVYLV